MINEYHFGTITIDGKVYHCDVEVRWDGEVLEWQRKESHLIDKEDIKRPLDQNPEILIIGTGDSGVAQVSPEAEKEIKERGIKLIVDITGQAVRAFNIINTQSEKEGEKKTRVIGLFHLTC